MRSPVIAFSILAAAVSPSLVSGAPASPQLDNALTHNNAIPHNNAITRTQDISAHQVRRADAGPADSVTGLLKGVAPAAPAPAPTPSNDPAHRTQAMRKAKAQLDQPSTDMKVPAPPAAAPPTVAKKSKRAIDYGTAGGNAYSGAAMDSSGGDVYNDSDEGGITNDDGSSKHNRLSRRMPVLT